MSHDRTNEQFTTGDNHNQHTDLLAANRDGATRAFQDQLNVAMFGFLNGADRALGGEGKAKPKETEATADATKEKGDHKGDQKAEAQFLAMATLGLTDINHNAKDAGERVAEQQRMIAFESIYASATGNKDNHSGMKPKDREVNELTFTGNPQLNTTGGNKQLSFA